MLIGNVLTPLNIPVPYHFDPRLYQQPIFNYMDLPGENKRAVLVWHRRAGKDKTLLNVTGKEMFKRVGNYYYFFPTYKQGRMALWEAVDKDGFRVRDHIPKELRLRTNDTTMLIETVNHSTLQIIGTDDYDRIVGTNPVGCVFSEYSLQNPAVWTYISPILAENGGWAIFNFTPRGKNHGWDILQLAKEAGWFHQVLTVDDTHAISQVALDQERMSKRKLTGSDAAFLQEYYCDFTVSLPGAYYGDCITAAETAHRIGLFPYERGIPVHTVWDLGIGDANAIWFFQLIGREIRIIEYMEDQGKGMDYYIREVLKKEYVYGEHYAPHDIRNKEYSNGQSRKDTAATLGINFRIVPQIGLMDGIQAARLLFDRCYFNDALCEQGLNALKFYHKEYNDDKHMYEERPEHDWSSHGADGFRYLALAVGAISGGFYEEESNQSASETTPEDEVYD